MKELNENAQITLQQRYLLKNEEGKVIETIPEMFTRIAKFVASNEEKQSDKEKYEQIFYNMMTELDFLPNSPTIMNAGKEDGQLSACFVLPIEDSMESIFETLKRTALIHKSGGGTGFSFSRLREKDAVVKTTGGIASGPISFMKVFNSATEEVKQGGCFVGDTLIATEKGPVCIKDLKEGDLVYSFDQENKRFILTPCTNPFKTKIDTEVWELRTNIPDLNIYATPDHPFKNWMIKNYTKLSSLVAGNALESFGNDNITVFEVKYAYNDDVWNVEVPATHNYVVCTKDMKHGVVVSNSRRGASMAMLRIDHPDIAEFIGCKTVDGVLNNFNISIALTDKFMEAVKSDNDFDLVSPKDGKVVRTVKAKEIFDKIVTNAWNNGEPGIFFIDEANRYNPTPKEGDYESTNPCGEQVLLPNESCNLGSINLANMVKEKNSIKDLWDDVDIHINSLDPYDDDFNAKFANRLLGYIDFYKLTTTVENAVRFLDNIIDLNCFPFKEIEECTKRNRKIGLGVMGWAEMLIKLGIGYNTPIARKLAEYIMNYISNSAKTASYNLAQERGVFPTWEDSIYNSGVEVEHKKYRNAATTTIAPTGTLSLIAGTSSGIEPYFSFAYERHILDGRVLQEKNALLAEVLKEYGIYSDELIKKIIDNHGTLKGITEIPEKIRSVFVSAHEISPKDHVLMQANFQKHVDNAISKTINFTNDATKEDISDAFMLAYETKCKGLTVYRDGSRSTQVLVTSSKKEDKKEGEKHEEPVKIVEVNNSNIDVYNRPKKLYGSTKTIQIGCGKILVTVNHDNNNKVKEVIIITGKGGGCHAQSEAIGRLISISLRANVDIHEIIHQLRGIRCDSCKRPGLDGISCPDAIGRYIQAEQEYLDSLKADSSGSSSVDSSNSGDNIQDNYSESIEVHEKSSNKCPVCGAELAHESGCVKCYNCDYSKCD